MKKGKGYEVDRGRVESVVLKRSFTFNGNVIKRALIEIDHINYGLNQQTKSLNTKRRTHFSIADVEKFLMELDGEQIMPRGYVGRVSQFEVRIDCPVSGRFHGKQFILIFDTHYDKSDEIHTITLYPGW